MPRWPGWWSGPLGFLTDGWTCAYILPRRCQGAASPQTGTARPRVPSCSGLRAWPCRLCCFIDQGQPRHWRNDFFFWVWCREYHHGRPPASCFLGAPPCHYTSRGFLTRGIPSPLVPGQCCWAWPLDITARCAFFFFFFFFFFPPPID